LRRFVRLSLGFGLLVWGLGCQAPHDNPLDPQSPAYRPPQPPSAVTDLRMDSLSGAMAYLVWSAPQGAFEYRLYSGAPGWNGRSLSEAVEYTGELPGVKPAGQRQSQWIDVPRFVARRWALFSLSETGLMSGTSNLVLIEPQVDDRIGTIEAWANSFHQAEWEGLDYYELQLNALIDDPDGVDSVWVIIADTMQCKLLLDQDELLYNLQIPQSQLPGRSLERLIGYPIWLYYRDRARFLASSQPFYLIRVIYIPPETIYPAYTDTLVPNPPQLIWQPYYADFKFTYAVEIVHVSSNFTYTLWFRREGISADSTSLNVGNALPTYPLFLYWTVSVVDEFDNRAASLQARFQVSE